MEPRHLYKCMRSDCGREVPEAAVDDSLKICSCPAVSHLVLSDDRYGVLCADWCRRCKTKYPCAYRNHFTCFESLLPREEDETQHQPTSARRLRDDAKIKSHLSEIFSTETDIEEQRRLHLEDNRVARWFIAESAPADPRRGILYVTDRFQRLSAQGKLAENQFPSIVSFIGDTGKGKSTLIRAMIKTSTRTVAPSFNPDDLTINDLRLNSLETPVTAIQHPNFNLTPTSAGIHLYADPQTLSARSPILFADCEGFNTHTKAQAVSGAEYLNKSHEDMPFRRKWTIERGEHKRQSITDGLYPQFMYLFSDVICYVMDGSASISKDIIRLLEWAARGEADSVNMEPYKALVVVMNQPSNWQKEWESQEFSARDSMLEQLPETGWRESSLLVEAVDRINSTRDGNKIFTTYALVKKYFQRIDVCYIPRRKDRGVEAGLMLSKYRLLRHTILSCSKEAQTKKKESYNRFNFTDLSSQFDLAFHHFATSDGPFDMYKIARKGRVEPREMSDHILVLMKCMEETDNLHSTHIFGEIVASSLVNASLRDRQRALPPQHTFETAFEFEKTCLNGIERFYRSHKRCEFTDGDENCIIKYEHHHEGHKSIKKGIGRGPFIPEDISNCITGALKDIRYSFIKFHDELCWRDGGAERPTDGKLIRGQRLRILSHPKMKAFWKNCKSYKSCFTCLRSIPHHVLPCGHALCTTCVLDFARPSKTAHSAYDISQCFLCNTTFQRVQIIRTIPLCAGIRILTLDGGGVRGIIELVILKRLMDITGLGINIGYFFDLIVGTSTGGLISLGLALRGLGLTTMFEAFTSICENTFSGPLGHTVKKIGFAFNWYDSIYDTGYLKNYIAGLLSVNGKDLSMFGSPIQTGEQPITRVGVTTVKKGEIASTVANYNRIVPEQRPDFEREENDSQDLTAWEAGLCTSAAPVYFSRYVKPGPSQDFYIDGGVKNNNPINWAINEAKQLWPRMKETQRTDILISLGTGKFENYMLWEPSFVFNRSWVKDIVQAFLQNLNGEAVWEDFKQGKGAEKYDPKTHHRLNATLPIKKCKLDDVRQMKLLREETERYLDPGNPKGGYQYLHSVAHRLLAKLFFFHPTSRARHDKGKGASLWHLPGVIRCRLDNHSTEVKTLVPKIAYFFSSNQDSLSDEVNENNKLHFTQDTVRRVRGHDAVFEVDHIITTSNVKSWQAVYVRFNDDPQYYPISGFPCQLDDLLSRVGEDKYQDTELPYPIPKPTSSMGSNQPMRHEPTSQTRYATGVPSVRVQNTATSSQMVGETTPHGMEMPPDAQGEEAHREENYLQAVEVPNMGPSVSQLRTQLQAQAQAQAQAHAQAQAEAQRQAQLQAQARAQAQAQAQAQVPRPYTYSSTTRQDMERKNRGFRGFFENEERLPRR
ncbi:hypothetical protein TWF481_010799 [Arthrobotrys musiformis]|uniref:PNPLA domain-containing protein n=1 Tax=Arthrobotrys musiformis TaxID=47236 RepID=A0AAV9W1V7_9PEZI